MGCIAKLNCFVMIGWEATSWSHDLADFYVKIFNMNSIRMVELYTVWKIQRCGLGKQSLSLNINILESSEKIIKLPMTSIQPAFCWEKHGLLLNIYS